jgi:HNH endonuclease
LAIDLELFHEKITTPEIHPTEKFLKRFLEKIEVGSEFDTPLPVSEWTATEPLSPLHWQWSGDSWTWIAEPCWIWTGCRIGPIYRYGSVGVGNGKTQLTHVVMFKMTKGSISGELDHLCRNTSCCNPDHVEDVSREENCRRSGNVGGTNARKTVCPKGHDLVEGNLIPSQLKLGRRSCLTCDRENARTRRANNLKAIRAKDRIRGANRRAATKTQREPSIHTVRAETRIV